MFIGLDIQSLVLVRLIDSSTFAPVTGVAFGSATVYISKNCGTPAQKTLASGDWVELDATNYPGCYILKLSTTDTNTAGMLLVSASGGSSEKSINVFHVTSIHGDLINSSEITSGNQFKVYKEDGVTVRHTYNTFDIGGSPASTNISKRTKI